MSNSQQEAAIHPLIEQMGSQNPKMQMLAKLLKEQQAVQSQSTKPASKKLVEIIKKKEKLVRKLKARNHQLMGYMEYLIERNDLLASAVGACPDCWGDDESCNACGGQGRPGAMNVHRDAFNYYIKPSLRPKIKKTRTEPSTSETGV